jgi:hypothetical protein
MLNPTTLLALLFLPLGITLAHAGHPGDVSLPSVSDYELAVQAKHRPLSAAEVAVIANHWLTTFVYLEAATQASLLQGRTDYLALPTPPSDRCINTALFNTFNLARDGVLSQSDLESLWNTDGAMSFYAYQISTNGEESTYLLGRVGEAGYSPTNFGSNNMGEYFSIRRSEPADLTEKIDHWYSRTPLNVNVGIARMIELGQPARDIYWQRVQSLPTAPPPITDKVAFMYRSATVLNALFALGATNDPRIHSLHERERPVIGREGYQYLQSLRSRSPGSRDLRYERPVLFWKTLCTSSRSTRRKTPDAEIP